MNLLRYKDYQGSVQFEDGRLVIQVLHIDDFITAECNSASAVQSVFEELVDDYLETCAELKKEPSKPFKGSLNIRMPPALHRRAALAAAEGGESINALITRALHAYLENAAEEASQSAKEKLLSGWLHSVSQIHRNWEPFASLATPTTPADVEHIGWLRVQTRMRSPGREYAPWKKSPRKEIQ
jgi:predicted HicB family RNase H-like nuclease